MDGLLFFAQRMDELLFDFTLDSYKPAALCAPTLCREALAVIARIQTAEMEPSSLEPILEELTISVQGDPVAKTLLDVDLDAYILKHPDTPLDKKRSLLEVLERTLNLPRYTSECMVQLAGAIESRQKQLIDTLASKLITALTNRGVSKAFLFRETQDFFFKGDAPAIASASQFEDFAKLIFPVLHDFRVILLVSKEIDRVARSISSFGLELIQELPEAVAEFARGTDFTPTADERFVSIKELTAHDCYSARAEAERRIDMLRDLFTLFSHRNELKWRPKTIITQCCNDRVAMVDMPSSAMQRRIDPSENFASKKLNWLLRRLSLRRGKTFSRFNRVVDLHGICATDSIPENQLLNIWICLETLVPARHGRSKISSVVEAFDPFARRTYITRLIECAVRDLMLWNSHKVRAILRKVSGGRGKPVAVRLLRLLALEANSAAREELYGELRDFHLLRFRLWKLHEALKSTRTAKHLIDAHARRVDWQIRRIYRVRNSLVHAGTSPPFLPTLIENGHDYLDMALDELIDLSCGERQILTIDQAFELERVLTTGLMRGLTEDRAFSEDVLDALYIKEIRGSDYEEPRGTHD